MTEIALIGAPLDLGAGHRGVDSGPSAFRIAGLQKALEKLGLEVFDEGNILVELPSTVPEGDVKARFLKEILLACENQRKRVYKALKNGRLPLVLGGDHSIAIGTVAGVSQFYREQNQEIGVIWVDAHADMNTTESTISGNIHGMPLSASLGLGDDGLVNLGGFAPKIKPENVALIGLRDVDREEAKIVKSSGVHAYTMTDIDRLGMPQVIKEAIEKVSCNTVGIHLSFDFDGLDPEIAPGVGTPVRGGIKYREAHYLMEKIAETNTLLALEMVELNPILDHRNQTAELGIELILSAFGKSIL